MQLDQLRSELGDARRLLEYEKLKVKSGNEEVTKLRYERDELKKTVERFNLQIAATVKAQGALCAYLNERQFPEHYPTSWADGVPDVALAVLKRMERERDEAVKRAEEAERERDEKLANDSGEWLREYKAACQRESELVAENEKLCKYCEELRSWQKIHAETAARLESERAERNETAALELAELRAIAEQCGLFSHGPAWMWKRAAELLHIAKGYT